MRIGVGLLAGLVNSCWAALVGFLVVPQYLKYLGVEAYGLIGFFAMMQAMLSLLDMGMAPTMNREVARHSALGTIKEVRTLLHTLSILYLGVALLIAIAIYLLAPFLALHWLKSGKISPDVLEHAIILMGIVIACRFPIGLYQGALMGKQLQITCSMVNILMVTLGSAGGVMVLAFIVPSIEAFFIWQALVGILQLSILRWAAWNAMGHEGITKFQLASLKKIWRFSVGMSGVAISSIILLQLDKILLSQLLTLEDFGLYSLAVLLASGLSILVMPFFNVTFPYFSSLLASKQPIKILRAYKAGTKILSGVIFAAVFSAAFNAHEIIYLWVQDASIASKVAPLFSLLILGGAINSVMIFPYTLKLAYGRTKISIIIIVSLIFIYAPLTYVLVMNYGAMGGAMGWLILNIIYLFFGSWFTHQYLFQKQALSWVTGDVIFPACIAFVIILIGNFIFHDDNALINLIIGGLFFIIAVLVNYFFMTKRMKIAIRKILSN
jgi:O-antigen/teichoic acid export membrane protein